MWTWWYIAIWLTHCGKKFHVFVILAKVKCITHMLVNSCSLQSHLKVFKFATCAKQCQNWECFSWTRNRFFRLNWTEGSETCVRCQTLKLKKILQKTVPRLQLASPFISCSFFWCKSERLSRLQTVLHSPTYPYWSDRSDIASKLWGGLRKKTGKVPISMRRLNLKTPEVPLECTNRIYCCPATSHGGKTIHKRHTKSRKSRKHQYFGKFGKNFQSKHTVNSGTIQLKEARLQQRKHGSYKLTAKHQRHKFALVWQYVSKLLKIPQLYVLVEALSWHESDGWWRRCLGAA